MKARRNLVLDFAENAARAQQLRRRFAEKFLPVVVHSEPRYPLAKTLWAPRDPPMAVARRSFLPPHQVPLRDSFVARLKRYCMLGGRLRFVPNRQVCTKDSSLRQLPKAKHAPPSQQRDCNQDDDEKCSCTVRTGER